MPIVTTDCRAHGPEIAYLHDGVNGIMTTNDVEAYSTAAVALCAMKKGARLRVGCRVGAETYTLENMVQRFTDGIANCLEAPPHQKQLLG